MLLLTREQKYYIGQQFSNLEITISSIATNMEIDRGIIISYLLQYYGRFEPLIKKRLELQNAK